MITKLDVDLSTAYKQEIPLRFEDDNGVELILSIAPIPGKNKCFISAVEDGVPITVNRMVGLDEWFFGDVKFTKFEGDFAFMRFDNKRHLGFDIYELGEGIRLCSYTYD